MSMLNLAFILAFGGILAAAKDASNDEPLLQSFYPWTADPNWHPSLGHILTSSHPTAQSEPENNCEDNSIWCILVPKYVCTATGIEKACPNTCDICSDYGRDEVYDDDYDYGTDGNTVVGSHDKCEDKEQWCNHGVKCEYKEVQSDC